MVAMETPAKKPKKDPTTDELASARSDMQVASEAFKRLGLLASKDMDASCLFRDRLAGCEWPSESAVGVEDLPEVHRSIYKKVPTAHAVIGVHTIAVKAVAGLDEGVRALTQDGAVFYRTVAICNSFDDAPQALEAMPEAIVLMVRGKGMYVFGGSISAAFVLAFNLNLSCRVQLLAGSHTLVPTDPDVLIKTRDCQRSDDPLFGLGAMEWPAVKAWVNGKTMPLQDGQRIGEEGSEEKTLREALSLAHKSVASRKDDILVWNHMSAKFSEGILITPGDRMWHQMEPETLKFGSHNVTADVLHSAVYSSTTMSAVVHLHTPAVQAVACFKEGFIPPEGSEFVDRVAYHEWEGFSDDPDECQRVSAAIAKVPECRTLILLHHGAITFGCSVEEAFDRHLKLDAACREQISRKGTQSLSLKELCN